MSTKKNLVNEITDAWPSLAAFSRAVEVTPDTVRQWRARGYIPVGNWLRVRSAYRQRTKKRIKLERFLEALPHG
ncbi:MAG: hypothetical protein QGI09_07870 [Dehalococcoidia bacterium]|jgi:hypothetical protein|nr:hypothetical protein [Dehalococcoidia bacterium]